MSVRAVRRALREARRAIRLIGASPAEAYAWVYLRLALHQRLHGLNVSAEQQLALIPRRLRATSRLLSQPYRVPLTLVRWGGRPPGGEARRGNGEGGGFVFDGDWDLVDRRPLMDYLKDYVYSRTVLEYLGDGLPFRSTAQYAEMSDLVARGLTDTWQARGCRTMVDVDRYFEAMRHTFESIRRHGYRSQRELGSGQPFDEIKVFVDRDGEIHKQQGAGHHRIAMAKLLQVPEIPVLVMGVHRNFALSCQSRFGLDVITSIDLGLRALACNPPHGS